MLVVLLLVAALGLAFANGSNDNFKATATLYGSKTLSYRQSLTLATAAQIFGSLGSVVLAGALLKAFSGKGLVPASVVGDPAFLVAVGGGAAVTVLLCSRYGLPVSTTHALIGGLVGAGLVLSGSALAWSALGSRYLVPLAFSPLLAFAGASVLYPLARFARGALKLEPETCVCIGETTEQVDVTADGAMVLRRSGALLTIAQQSECTTQYAGQVAGVSAQRLLDGMHIGSAFSLGFARGLNDTPKILALLVAAGWAGLDARVSLGIVAVAMAAGGIILSRRVAETMSNKITGMNHGQGLIANSVASGLVIGASLLGSPVSTTHCSTGAIFGIGVWSGSADRKVVAGIVLAWVATLPVAAILAATIATVL